MCSTRMRPFVFAGIGGERGALSLVMRARPIDFQIQPCCWSLTVDNGRARRRHAHTKRRHSTTVTSPEQEQQILQQQQQKPVPRPLSCLSWPNLVRSYTVTAISSIPILLQPSMTLMTWLAHSKSRWLNPDHNRLVHALLKRTFYMQFCAGETPPEVRATIDGLKTMGYQGVMLGHAREVVMSKEDEAALDASDSDAQAEHDSQAIQEWKHSSLETVALTQKGDFVALKFTGAGRQALHQLKKNAAGTPELEHAISTVCDAARDRGVKLLFDAEQFALQPGIERWTLHFMHTYNKHGAAVVYGTYQAYMKRCPEVLAQHLATARREGFVLGIKLVRGAYLGSDPRELFWGTIEETHRCYDSLARCILQRTYSDQLPPAKEGQSSFPDVDLVLATHNAESVNMARQIRDEQVQRDQPRINMAYGQLMGMADHISCDLIQEARASEATAKTIDVPQAYKYLVWGTMGECMKYLLRRAHENQDAISRTVEARRALGREIAARIGLV